MKILSIRPAPPGGGNALARFDIELDCGLRLFNLKLANSSRGLRVHAASAFGSPTATFEIDMSEQIICAAMAALGDTNHDRNSLAA